MKFLSIIIPVYNEVGAIEETLSSIKSMMINAGINYEIVVVNDGSTDGTREVLESFEGIRLINSDENRGYGASLKKGIRSAKYDNIAITDADGTYPNERIPEMFTFLGDYDMVVGKRSFKNLPNKTKPAKWFINKLANYLAGFKIPDINSGLRLFKKEIAVKYFNIISDGFSFTTTITLAMLTNNYNVKYIPIDYYKREGKSKIKPIYDTFNFIQMIIRTVMYFNPLKVFVPLAFFLLFISILVLVGSSLWMERVLDATFSILFLSGIQMLAIGMIADLIDKRMKM
ncbi:MAG: glycosyltransferase family 2 protein [Bacteroidales bacterium]